MRYSFIWNEEKNQANFKKHSVWFEEASTIWTDPRAHEFFDPEHSTDEDRYIRIGHSTAHKFLLVIFCERDSGNVIRIISARKATREEREQYEEGI